MADFIPPEHAETAKAVAGATLGIGLAVFVRHPGSIIKVIIMVPLGIGCGVLYGPLIDGFLGIGISASSSLAALTSVPVANGIVRAVESIDFAKMLPWKKEG